MRRSQTHNSRERADLPGSIHRSHARELGVLLWTLAAISTVIIAIYGDLSIAAQRLQRSPIRIFGPFSGVFVFFAVFSVIYKVRRRSQNM